MNTEVTSCTPLAEIASHTREALCDYALDPIVCIFFVFNTEG